MFGLLLRRVADRARHALAERLDAHPQRDQLTGLANREALMAHLQRAVQRRLRFSLLYVDLDEFKLVNDTLGHAAGDELLGHVASAMQAAARRGDLLARQGGDEFVLVAVGVGDTDALACALRDAITRTTTLRDIRMSVGTSIGIADFPHDGEDATTLLEAADAAMYEAKRRGRNEISRPAAGARLRRADEGAALQFTTALPDAIKRDELVLHWQPIVDLDDLAIAGLEALVRWNHPELGFLQPEAFLPFAQQTGIITAVDGWVAGAVNRQRVQWQSQGLDPYVGFNLAPQYARRPGALESLLQRLTANGLSLDHMTIELSESETLREDRRLLAFVHGLHEAGVTVALDDFGRAYSSLDRLRDVPVRWIKLDRAFIEAVPNDSTATEVLIAILVLLRALKLEIIVEGVEREAQLAVLREQGVRLAQGFLLGRPVPAVELRERLAASPASLLSPLTRDPPAESTTSLGCSR